MMKNDGHGHFSTFTNLICEKSPLQRKRIESLLAGSDDTQRAMSEDFAKRYTGYLEARGLSVEYAVDCYLEMCGDFMAEQKHFLRKGEYRCKSRENARRNVYHNENKMVSYLHGLIMSLFVWNKHFEMFRFFIDNALARETVESCLEIGAGHGLFTSNAALRYPAADFTVVDISPFSIRMTSEIVKHFGPAGTAPQYENADVMTWDNDKTYDLIIMGEVLEHVEEPDALLRKIQKKLKPGGLFFIITCANAPAIDHVFCFPSAKAIVDTITEAGFEIVKELVVSPDEIPPEKWKDNETALSYAAVVTVSA